MAGTLTFSVEIELGWGVVQYGKLDVLSPKRRAETESLVRLLDLCDNLEVPITFNIVGHLLRNGPLSSYDGGHDGGWFEDIPKTGPESDPEFYAPDLANLVKSATVDHEICTHTYSHVECAKVSDETLRWEFDRVLDEHDDFGLDRPISVVPPRHSPPPKEILRDYNFQTVRSLEPSSPNMPSGLERLKLGKNILTGMMPSRPPQMVDGIVETYATSYPTLTAPFLPAGQKNPHPVFRMIPLPIRKKLHRRNLSQALSTSIHRDSHIHLWSHLWEIANDSQWPQIENFLRDVAASKNSGKLDVRTMDELNAIIRAGGNEY